MTQNQGGYHQIWAHPLIFVPMNWPFTTFGTHFCRFSDTVTLAKECGYEGIGYIPLRFWKERGRHGILAPYNRDFIKTREDAWSNGSWFEMILRHLGKHPKGPTILDKILFKRYDDLHLSHAIRTVHGWSVKPNELVEIHPDLSTEVMRYFEAMEDGARFCADTHHLYRPHRGTGEVIEDVYSLVVGLGSAIKMIHLHPSVDEMNDLRTQGYSQRLDETCVLLEWHADHNAPIVVEYFPKDTIFDSARHMDDLVMLRDYANAMFNN